MRILRLSRMALLSAPPEHRSPGWRRRSAGLLLLLVLMGVSGYWYLTRQARLISIARAYLEDLSGGAVDIARVDFAFFGGIHITDLIVRTPASYAFGPAGGAGRIVFRAADVQLRHRPLSLLVGHLDVEKIVAIRPEFIFVTDKETGRSNWQSLMWRPVADRGHRGSMPLPQIELRHCILRSGLLNGTDLKMAEPVQMDVAATPASQDPRVYTCVLRPAGPDRLTRKLRIDLDNSTVAGDLPGVQVAQFQLSLPAEYARWCDILELTGQIGAEDIEYNPSQGAKCAINLSHVTLSVPFDESEFYGQHVRSRRLVHLQEVTGRIVFEPAQASVEISGLLNGERLRVHGTVSGYNGPLKAIGYDLQINAQRLAMPDSRDPYAVNQIALLGPRALKVLHQYDPTAGWMSFDGRIIRPPGQDSPVKLRGVLKTYDAAGRFDDFPYHGEQARSTIRFTDEGIFFKVLARRGPAVLQVDGWTASASSYTDADIKVDAVGVPLDDELYKALPEKLQSLWQHFDFYGQIWCQFHLWRRGGTPEDGPADWNWTMHMSLVDVAARYEGFPFMQWGLNGTIDAADGVVSRIDLRAVNVDAVTRITGTADLRDERRAVDLRITTKNRPLTADLMPALPPRSRDMLIESAVKGLFDIDATVKLSAATRNELLCQADLRWHDGSIRPKQFPYPLGDVQGVFRLDQAARRIDIREVTARNGPATVRVAGSLDLREGLAGRLQLAVDDMPLDDRLYQALPAVAQSWWQKFEPKGGIGARSDVDLTESPTRKTHFSHRTSLLLAGNKACWESFPLPLKDINGKVVLTAGRCEFQDVTATHESGQIRVDGAIDWDDAGTRAAVKVAARDLPLDEPLRLAVPWQIRRVWNSWLPTGHIDLDLASLRFTRSKEGGATWDLDGSCAGRLQKMDMAIDVKDAAIKASVTAHVDEGRQTFEGHGRLEADRAVLDTIPVTDARADWVRAADGTFQMRSFEGKALGGSLAGFFEIEPAPHGQRYGIVLALDHADPGQLAEILTHGQMNGVVGTIQMQMRLRGLLDQPETRSGTAEIQLTGRGLYRLPVLLELANVLDIPLVGEPGDPQQIGTKLTIMGDQAILDSFELRDKSLVMLGNGMIDLPTRQASLTVIAARPRDWPKLPILTELLEGTLRELIEVHGTGPLNDLKFEARPLRSLQAALQTLASHKHHIERPERPPKVPE